MIIKNYSYPTRNLSHGGTLHILEGVTDVVLHMHAYQGNSNGPDLGDSPNAPRVHVEHAAVHAPDDVFYFVDYTDQRGLRSRLKVTSYAYLCNDQGKTIEKVGGHN